MFTSKQNDLPSSLYITCVACRFHYNLFATRLCVCETHETFIFISERQKEKLERRAKTRLAIVLFNRELQPRSRTVPEAILRLRIIYEYLLLGIKGAWKMDGIDLPKYDLKL